MYSKLSPLNSINLDEITSGLVLVDAIKHHSLNKTLNHLIAIKLNPNYAHYTSSNNVSVVDVEAIGECDVDVVVFDSTLEMTPVSILKELSIIGKSSGKTILYSKLNYEAFTSEEINVADMYIGSEVRVTINKGNSEINHRVEPLPPLEDEVVRSTLNSNLKLEKTVDRLVNEVNGLITEIRRIEIYAGPRPLNDIHVNDFGTKRECDPHIAPYDPKNPFYPRKG